VQRRVCVSEHIDPGPDAGCSESGGDPNLGVIRRQDVGRKGWHLGTIGTG